VPTYTLKNTETNEVFEEFMSMNELDAYLAENPKIEQIPGDAPGLISGYHQKPDQGFRDVLRKIKKDSQKGISRSTINTF